MSSLNAAKEVTARLNQLHTLVEQQLAVSISPARALSTLRHVKDELVAAVTALEADTAGNAMLWDGVMPLAGGMTAATSLGKVEVIMVDLNTSDVVVRYLESSELEVLKLSSLISAKQSTEFTGKRVVFTGTHGFISRAELKRAAEIAGAIITGSVSESTDLVVFAEDCGPKLQRALELRVKTMTVPRFVERMKHYGILPDCI